MKLRVLIDDNEFSTYEYGDTKTVKIYNMDDDTTFNATGYTGTVIVHKNGIQRLDDLPLSWTDQAHGVGTFALTSTNMFSSDGIYSLFVALTSSSAELHSRDAQILVFKQVQK